MHYTKYSIKEDMEVLKDTTIDDSEYAFAGILEIKMGDLIIRHHFLDGTTGVVLHTRNKYFYFYNGWIDLWSGERSVKKRMETAVRRTEDM